MSGLPSDPRLNAEFSPSPLIHPLRSGRAPWSDERPPLPILELRGGAGCEVVVVGAGITGAFAAEALTRQGKSVLIVDRSFPGRGSTAASTAMLLWEIDTSLVELAERYGFTKASMLYGRCLAAVRELGELVSGLAIDCNFAARPSLYLAESDASPDSLAAEQEARLRANLPSTHLSNAELQQSFGMSRPAALVVSGAAEADPVRLANGLLHRSFERGARLVADAVVDYQFAQNGAAAVLASGAVIEARHIVLATGYDMPSFVPSDLHRIVSTWCVATLPQAEARLWPHRALVWEAADPYLYARFDSQDRLLIGGEDAAISVADARESLMPEKAARLVQRMRGLQPQLEFDVSHSWSAAFGETADGLPLIGRVPRAPRAIAAYGYGGNGITFSYIASRMIAAIVAGEERQWFSDFALDR